MTLDALPRDLGDALRREIDPDETVRWVGQPSVWSFVLRTGVPGVLAGLGFIGFGSMLMYPAWMTWREVGGMSGNAGSQPAVGSVYAIVALGALLMAGGLWGLLSPWRESRRARRTVYAVTSTRVLQITVSKSGVVTAAAVEPGHPLSISRKERSPSVGDVFLYPVAMQGQPRALLSLLGVREPREVERIIRRTFDPPVAGG
jgi:hypothetical protein